MILDLFTSQVGLISLFTMLVVILIPIFVYRMIVNEMHNSKDPSRKS